MMEEAKQNIITSELRSDEDLLWAHVISDDEMPDLSPKARTIINIVFKIIWLLTLMNGLWQLFKTPPEHWAHLMKFYLPLIIGVFLLQWFFTKTNIGRSLKAQSKRSIYQNAIITNQRILLFNHNPSERRSFTQADISDSQMDYENGGLALRFSPRGNEKDSLLIGAADFKTALNIIKSHFLKTRPNS